VRGTGDGSVTAELATDALSLLEIDARGLDAMDRQLLTAMAEHHAGGPVGLATMAATVSEPVETIEDVVEPYSDADRLTGAHVSRSPADRLRLATPRPHTARRHDSRPARPLRRVAPGPSR
jgi:Holliday junction resolvasome RuvABC ATP-dependent DNA helicase subunit